MTGEDAPVVREARPGDAAGIARVHVDTWRTTYRGIVPADHQTALSYEARERLWARQLAALDDPGRRDEFAGAGIFVAEAPGGQVVGFASCGRESSGDPLYLGELSALYVLEAWQGRGLGRRLVLAVADRLAGAGLRSMLVWVLAANPACRFYEALGGQVVLRKDIEIGGATLEEVAYGWPDVGLVGRRTQGESAGRMSQGDTRTAHAQAAQFAAHGRYTVIPRTLVFLRHGDDVLLLKGAPTKRLWANRYNGLGGHVERDETIEAAARREVAEEAGIAEIADLRLVGLVNVEGDPTGVLLCVFTGSVGSRLTAPSAEGTPEWVPVAALDSVDLVDDPVFVRRLIESDRLLFGHIRYTADGRAEARVE